MMSSLRINAANAPLHERTAIELHARASELRDMAKTATTSDTKIALEGLAGRFAALANRRAAEERGALPKAAPPIC